MTGMLSLRVNNSDVQEKAPAGAAVKSMALAQGRASEVSQVDEGASTVEVSAAIARAAADVVIAYLARHELPAGGLPDFCEQIASAISMRGKAQKAPVEASISGAAVVSDPVSVAASHMNDYFDGRRPAIDPRKSVEEDWLICLEDGVRRKMMQRYLRVRYRMSPEQYRARWSLPDDYPMVAPGYARRRAAIARETGFAGEMSA